MKRQVKISRRGIMSMLLIIMVNMTPTIMLEVVAEQIVKTFNYTSRTEFLERLAASDAVASIEYIESEAITAANTNQFVFGEQLYQDAETSYSFNGKEYFCLSPLLYTQRMAYNSRSKKWTLQTNQAGLHNWAYMQLACNAPLSTMRIHVVNPQNSDETHRPYINVSSNNYNSYSVNPGSNVWQSTQEEEWVELTSTNLDKNNTASTTYPITNFKYYITFHSGGDTTSLKNREAVPLLSDQMQLIFTVPELLDGDMGEHNSVDKCIIGDNNYNKITFFQEIDCIDTSNPISACEIIKGTTGDDELDNAFTCTLTSKSIYDAALGKSVKHFGAQITYTNYRETAGHITSPVFTVRTKDQSCTNTAHRQCTFSVGIDILDQYPNIVATQGQNGVEEAEPTLNYTTQFYNDLKVQTLSKFVSKFGFITNISCRFLDSEGQEITSGCPFSLNTPTGYVGDRTVNNQYQNKYYNHDGQVVWPSGNILNFSLGFKFAPTVAVAADYYAKAEVTLSNGNDSKVFYYHLKGSVIDEPKIVVNSFASSNGHVYTTENNSTIINIPTYVGEVWSQQFTVRMRNLGVELPLTQTTSDNSLFYWPSNMAPPTQNKQDADGVWWPAGSTASTAQATNLVYGFYFYPPSEVKTYTKTVTFSGKYSSDETRTTSTTVTINVVCLFSTIEISQDATTHSITLTWAESDNADKYILLRDGVQVAELPHGTTSFTDSGLDPFTEYTYTLRQHNNKYRYDYAQQVTARTLSDTQLDYAMSTISEEYKAIISLARPREEWNTMLSNIFDANHRALFDQLLFIYDDATDHPNILIFKKSSPTTYALYNIIHNDFYIIENFSGLRFYLTGKTQHGYAGQQYENAKMMGGHSHNHEESEGFLYFKGSDGQKADLYLDNLSIEVDDKEMIDSFMDFVMGTMTQGTTVVKGASSPIAMCSTGESEGNPMTLRFHIKGENTLMGTAWSEIPPEYWNELKQEMMSYIKLNSAPIAIRPVEQPTIDDFQNKTGKLTFDDLWLTDATDLSKTVRTNGLLDLPVQGNLRDAPSIDLGNSHGMCEFNGGRYIFNAPANYNFIYVCSMPICYREIKVTMGMVFPGIGGTWGVGPSGERQDRFCSVLFRDGTFMVHSADDQLVDVVARGWYRDYTDMRLPYTTSIDGGTFNSGNVYATENATELGDTPTNSSGRALCHITLDAADLGTLSPIGTVVADATAEQRLQGYGHESLTPKDGKVYLYIREDDCQAVREKYVQNWVTVIPYIDAANMLGFGGSKEVTYRNLDYEEMLTGYLLFAELNEYTRKNAGIQNIIPNFTMPLTLDVVINPKSYGHPAWNGYDHAEVTNEANYRIEYGIYTMKTYSSNTWYLISMPYDVSNIYSLETRRPFDGTDDKSTSNYDESTLGTTPTTGFLGSQGYADGDLAATIMTTLLPDIFSGKGSGVRMNLIDVAEKQLGLTLGGRADGNGGTYRLVHYNPNIAGHGALDSHFYLYHQKSIGERADQVGIWNLNEKNDYSDGWELADYSTPSFISAAEPYRDQDGNLIENPKVLMRKNHVYAMYLPTTETERYWDGKYLIFEGYGPQTVNGKINYTYYRTQSGDHTAVSDEQMALQGNATFANYTTAEKTFAQVQNNYTFKAQNAGTKIYPTEVFMVLSAGNSGQSTITRKSMPRLPQETTDLEEHLPHVGDMLLRAWSEDGLNITSFAEQQVEVYTVDGRLFWRGMMGDGETRHLPAAQGIYIVHARGETVKLIVDN